MKKTVFCTAVLIPAAVFLILILSLKESKTGTDLAVQQIPGYLLVCGWETSSEKIRMESIVIPNEFSEVYSQYNGIQQSQGFDLSSHRGEKAVLVTCPVTNYEGRDDVYAELILSGTNLIGAALVSDSSDGFVKPLKNTKTEKGY